MCRGSSSSFVFCYAPLRCEGKLLTNSIRAQWTNIRARELSIQDNGFCHVLRQEEILGGSEGWVLAFGLNVTNYHLVTTNMAVIQ